MAEVAKWGSIKFKTSRKKVFSFQGMERSYSARWEAHDIIGKRPKMEFLGPGMDEISIEVILDAELGVKPRDALKKFRVAAKQGKVAYFYMKGKKVVDRKLYIESGTENWNEIWNKGELVRATAQLVFKEYR